jgi:hypothetical protein
MNHISEDPNRVKEDFEETILWLRTVHTKAKWTVARLEETYSDLKRRKLSPSQARERVKVEGLDQTGGAS